MSNKSKLDEINKLLGSVSFQKTDEVAFKGTIEKNLQPRTVEKKNFTFDPQTGKIHYSDGRVENFYLQIGGLLDNPTKFSWSEILNLPSVKKMLDFHCVEGWSVLDLEWEGITFQELFKNIGLKKEAKFAIFHALGETEYSPQGVNHYIECLSVNDLLKPEKEILLAYKLNGKFLNMKNGAPMRVIAPFDFAYKGCKFVHKIELTSKPVDGWWTLANPIYPRIAPVPAERLRKKQNY